jgi:hypothetical protein
MEHLPVDTATGKVKGTSSNAGSLPKPFDFSDVEVFGTIPRGGEAGQALVKQSGDDFDTLWTDFVTGESGIEPLVSGQNYIDVEFTAEKPSADWILNECHIVNEIDASPLNLAPGIITSKTTTGFRLQLNGAPNSSNYELHWAIGIVGPGGAGGGGGGGALGAVFNVLDYGAVADCQTLFDITMPNGPVVTSAGYTFTAADVGKTAIIRGASGGGHTPMIATIISVSGHSATLDTATTTALTNIQPDSFPRMDFGTDNTVAFVLACLAVPGPGQRNHDLGTPFTAAGTMNPILPGDGGTVYIPVGHYLLKQINTFPFWFFETNNIHIRGAGMGSTILFFDSWQSDGLLAGSFANHGLFQNVTLSDFTMWDLNYFYGAPVNTINMHGIDNLRIERVETVNGKGNGCINVQGYPGVTSRIYIRDCWVHGNTADGDSSGMSFGIEGDGMNVGQVSEVHIENNKIFGPQRHGYEGGGNCHDQYFIGNTVDVVGMSGINPTGGSTTVVMGNTVRNFASGFGIDFTVDVGAFFANDIRCIGNYVKSNDVSGQAGFRFQNTGGDESIPHVTRTLVANNWVESAYLYCSGVFLGDKFASILIEGNWFNVLRYGIDGGPFVASAGKYIIAKNNYFSCPVMPQMEVGNIILEGNIVSTPVAWYGSGAGLCNIDGQNVLTGAIYSNTNASGAGFRTTDNVEIIRGVTTDPKLIIWAVVTAANVITTYAYNPTGSTLNTGATCKFIVHRPIAP